MFVLLLVNLWVMSVVGVFSLFVLLAAAVLLHWEDIGVLERRLRSGRSKRAARKRSPTDSDLRTITTSAYVESVVRRIDEIIERDTPRNEAVSPPSLKVETLAFFQDILEAKIADDRDYAFKKISRTVVQVLSSEGIEVMTDAQNHAAMFTIDTITDPSKAGTVETVRPALVKQSQCIMTGYAQQFIDA
jgi:hypothetical protein